MEAHLAQIERLNPDVNAIITMIEPEAALALADDADRKLAAGEETGRLHGLPIAHKDLAPTAGMLTTFGSPIHRDFIPEEDALDRPAAGRGRRAANRQDQCAGVRSGLTHLQHTLWPNSQPLRSDEDQRR